jgi:hypothetical protein
VFPESQGHPAALGAAQVAAGNTRPCLCWTSRSAWVEPRFDQPGWTPTDSCLPAGIEGL